MVFLVYIFHTGKRITVELLHIKFAANSITPDGTNYLIFKHQQLLVHYRCNLDRLVGVNRD
jgi:hypothetical protein